MFLALVFGPRIVTILACCSEQKREQKRGFSDLFLFPQAVNHSLKVCCRSNDRRLALGKKQRKGQVKGEVVAKPRVDL